MKDINSITEDFAAASAVNSAALNNARKISAKGGFRKLCKSADNTLIFGDCYGSGSKPYNASVDFSGENVVFRCSCPSRQFPCKHCIAIMLDWVAGKDFVVEEIPEDIERKRGKIAQKAEAAAEDKPKKAAKPNKSAAKKKLQKQLEGLSLAEEFVNDIFSRGICSITAATKKQYMSLAKQLGDYYLPEPQTIMYEIISESAKLSENPDDSQTEKIIKLCVKLASSVKKGKDYINSKLESGEVLPENDPIYEAMGGVWKLSQLKDLGLYKENAVIIQLSFSVAFDLAHEANIDRGYWLDMETGEIYRTDNIRPLKAAKYIKAEDSSIGVTRVKELYRYPGGSPCRVRWEASEQDDVKKEDYGKALSKACGTIAEAVKAAKNELKNTLSRGCYAALIKFDSIEYAEDGHAVMKNGSEAIALTVHDDYPDALNTLKMFAGGLKGGALFGGMIYSSAEHKFTFCPFSVLTEEGIIAL